jgi:hypothetical protein
MDITIEKLQKLSASQLKMATEVSIVRDTDNEPLAAVIPYNLYMAIQEKIARIEKKLGIGPKQ